MYLLAVLICLVLFAAYGQWLAWMVLLTVLAVPWLSLAVSLPGMISCRFVSQCQERVALGGAAVLKFFPRTRFPAPAFSCTVEVTRIPTGETWRMRPGEKLPTEHCGQLLCVPKKCYVYDALGLFRHRKRKNPAFSVTVQPQPVKAVLPAQFRRRMALSWKRKPGGGFSENHELRLYRPGDGLNQVHWKLSAKVGKLIVREAMEPVQQELHLAVTLQEDGAKNDLQIGRLLYLGSELVEMGHPFWVLARTGSGVKTFPIRIWQQLQEAVKWLLCSTPTAQEQIPPVQGRGTFDLGGDANEA